MTLHELREAIWQAIEEGIANADEIADIAQAIQLEIFDQNEDESD